MFDSPVLETAIGLVFLFLGVSLVTTAIQEFIASMVKLRAHTLRGGIRDMIAEGERGLDFYNRVMAHPLITPTSDLPSYVSARQFSGAVLNVLSGSGTVPVAVQSLRLAVGNLPDAPYKTVLQSLFREGETEVADFEERLQHWFDQSMDRVSGTYKRISQWMSLAIGALLAFVFQANAIAVGSALWHEPGLRSGIANSATAMVKAGMPSSPNALSGFEQFQLAPIWQTHPQVSASWFVGCAITAIAVSLGAPFWFDLLQTFVTIRGSGPEPPRDNKSAPAVRH